MRIINPGYEILTYIERLSFLSRIERAGRTCYKSEDMITEDSALDFLASIRGTRRDSVLEHFNISVRFIHNRGFAHDLVRHRIASYNQESTRYCNYVKGRFDDQITVIVPFWATDEDCLTDEGKSRYDRWHYAMSACEATYFNLMGFGLSSQAARGVLPIDLKTEIVVTANLREWKHIFNLICSEEDHPDMRRVMIPLERELIKYLPEIYE